MKHKDKDQELRNFLHDAFNSGKNLNITFREYWDTFLKRYSRPPVISENDISEFANWLTHNNWFTFEDGKWRYTFEHGTAISKESYEKNYTKTWAELYGIYKSKK